MPRKDPEARREYDLEYRKRNRQAVLERSSRYQRDHAEQVNSYHREWYAAHRQQVLCQQRRYREANNERVKAHDRWRYSQHPEVAAEKATRRRAACLGASAGDPTAIRAIYRRAREVLKVDCYLCGKRIPLGQRHVDHIVPLSKGGEHSASNLAIACAGCNESKGAKMPHEVGVLL